MNNAIYPLFPYPLVVCGKKYSFSDAEKEYLATLELVENTGNSMSKNDKILDDPELSELRTFIDEQVLNYKKNLLQIKDENEIYVTQSWLNRSQSAEFHPRHRHPNSVLSGVLFIDENSDGKLPPIRFHRSQQMYPVDFSFGELNEFNASSREFDTEQGMLMLFPSLLEHDVDKNNSERTRSSISFNTYVRGTIGGRQQLTEVTIS